MPRPSHLPLLRHLGDRTRVYSPGPRGCRKDLPFLGIHLAGLAYETTFRHCASFCWLSTLLSGLRRIVACGGLDFPLSGEFSAFKNFIKISKGVTYLYTSWRGRDEVQFESALLHWIIYSQSQLDDLGVL